jgi:hypothetical protein
VLPAVPGVCTATREEVDRDAASAQNKEKFWRNKAAERREAVRKADARVQELEARVAALQTDMNPANVQDPNRLQNIDRQLREAQEALTAAQRDAAAAREAVANLEDEARRGGGLPGWVR